MDLYYHIVNEYEVKYCKLNTARSTALGHYMAIALYAVNMLKIRVNFSRTQNVNP